MLVNAFTNVNKWDIIIVLPNCLMIYKHFLTIYFSMN